MDCCFAPLRSNASCTNQHVPGTTQFSKDPNAAAAELYEGVNLSALKHDAKNPEIILIPQPSDDPNVSAATGRRDERREADGRHVHRTHSTGAS